MLRIKIRPSNKTNKLGEATLLFDITYHKQRIYISTSIRIPPKYWNHNKQEIFKNDNINSRLLNLELKKKKKEIVNACESVIEKNLEFTKENIVKNSDTIGSSLNQSEFKLCYKEFLKVKKKVLASSTYNKYKYLEKVFDEFEEKYKYKITFNSINNKFFEKFEDYFFVVRNSQTF